jgi:hypothetical protein
MERKFLSDMKISIYLACGLILLFLPAVPTAPGIGLPSAAAQTAAAPDIDEADEADEADDEDHDVGDLLQIAVPTALARPDADRSFSPLRAEGELRGHLWAPSTYDNRWHTTNRLDLRAWADVGQVDIVARVKFDYQDLEAADEGVGADVRELYAQYRLLSWTTGRLEMALGKKLIFWGKGDEVRPIDRVSPQDMTAFLFYDLNERKTGRVGLFGDIQITRKTRFEGFWSPYFESSRTPEPGDYFEPRLLRRLADSGIAVGDAQEPDAWTSNAAIGGRFMFSLFTADMALYAFQGYDPNPTYVVDRLGTHDGLPILPMSVAAAYPRITLYGADIERKIGPMVLRAEAAYQNEGALFNLDWSSDLSALVEHPRGVVEKRQLQYVFGIDKNDFFTRNLFLNVQFLGSHIFDHDARMIAPQSQNGVTAFLLYSFMDSKMTAWYRYIILFKDRDQRHHAEIAYTLLPWMQWGVGGMLFEGRNDTAYFGQYDDRDFVYAKVKLLF